MARYGLLAVVLMAVAVCSAAEVVVLTETPVAEFALPDGSVLKNAYIWRSSSQGLMIMHDGGNYFLNYQLLPDDWKAAYLGEPAGAVQPAVPATPAAPLDDQYKAGPILEKIPDLTAAGRQYLLRKDLPEELDKSVLALSLLQSLLANNRDAAKRFILIIEEKKFEIGAVALDQLFVSCGNCAGDGHLTKTCKICGGSGKCPKCEGEGTRTTGLGDSRVHCTTCRGTGVCRDCKGEGKLTPSCPQCNGAGKVVNRSYCEIKRAQLVRQINALSSGGTYAAVTTGSTSGIGKVLADLPNLDAKARAYYLSDGYAGGMDTNILVACVLHSLLKDDSEAAKRFDLMLRVQFPKSQVLAVEDYVKPCKKCDSTGQIGKDCSACDGSGKCARCEGTGERTLEVGGSIHCTTCRGTGKCRSCGGDGKLVSRCPACEGRGRILERQRAEIKLGLLVDKLNEFHAAQ